jgi:hypothetical protein
MRELVVDNDKLGTERRVFGGGDQKRTILVKKSLGVGAVRHH